MLDILHILVLNDLSDAPHNLFIKCFASRHKEKERSLKKLFESSWKQLSASLPHCVRIDVELQGIMEITDEKPTCEI